MCREIVVDRMAPKVGRAVVLTRAGARVCWPGQGLMAGGMGHPAEVDASVEDWRSLFAPNGTEVVTGHTPGETVHSDAGVC